jgi:hypothetical protein
MNDIDQIKNVDTTGEDLIILTGVPGSRWSHINKILMADPTINRSDCNTTYRAHKGSYFGPFDNLRDYSKQELLDIFAQGFEHWNGKKIIKSHWFVYDLDYLAELFPKATIIGVYVPDDVAFRRWKAIGGFDIDYPDYSWFKDDKTMKYRIKEGNAYLLKFFTERGFHFKIYKNYIDMGNEANINITNPFTQNPPSDEWVVKSPLIAIYRDTRPLDGRLLRRYLKKSSKFWEWIDDPTIALGQMKS